MKLVLLSFRTTSTISYVSPGTMRLVFSSNMVALERRYCPSRLHPWPELSENAEEMSDRTSTLPLMIRAATSGKLSKVFLQSQAKLIPVEKDKAY